MIERRGLTRLRRIEATKRNRDTERRLIPTGNAQERLRLLQRWGRPRTETEIAADYVIPGQMVLWDESKLKG